MPPGCADTGNRVPAGVETGEAILYNPAGVSEQTGNHPSGIHSLTGKVVLVTGSSRGIGAAIARAAADAGADVAIGYRERSEAAAEVVERIRDSGRQAVAFQADGAVGGDFEGFFEHFAVAGAARSVAGHLDLDFVPVAGGADLSHRLGLDRRQRGRRR